jgi:hypothetical protein
LRQISTVIAPIISYDDIDYVADGGAAAWAFECIAAGTADGKESTLRQALEEYCRRDTLAMVEVHNGLLKAVS